MKLARAQITPFALRLRVPLASAHGIQTLRHGALLALESEDGLVGYGEATAAQGFGLESPEESLAAIQALCEALMTHDSRPSGALFAVLDAQPLRAPAARFAVETALLDLLAQSRGIPLADLLGEGRAVRRSVPVNALLSATRPDAAAHEARRALERGFSTLKLKVGADRPAADCARLAAVRREVGDDAELRIDANGAWSVELAIEVLRELDSLELEVAEQPVAPDDVPGLARVRAAVLVPIAADESASDFARAARVLESRAADSLVLKPAVLGGLRPAAMLAQRARAAGVRVWVTTSLDGAIARAAALALAAALPDPLPACGLATGDLLAEDLGDGPEPKKGFLSLSENPGLGAAPGPGVVRALATGPTLEQVAR
ncbi:MAG TPA: mandelate racemase/muconate lactonizing enzyme family protein [Myxococcota bacterium]|nr:mandelate racemase/muconate lactonizing enzyme family protein [Myxococcota bacterium]